MVEVKLGVEYKSAAEFLQVGDNYSRVVIIRHVGPVHNLQRNTVSPQTYKDHFFHLLHELLDAFPGDFPFSNAREEFSEKKGARIKVWLGKVVFIVPADIGEFSSLLCAQRL